MYVYSSPNTSLKILLPPLTTDQPSNGIFPHHCRPATVLLPFDCTTRPSTQNITLRRYDLDKIDQELNKTTGSGWRLQVRNESLSLGLRIESTRVKSRHQKCHLRLYGICRLQKVNGVNLIRLIDLLTQKTLSLDRSDNTLNFKILKEVFFREPTGFR